MSKDGFPRGAVTGLCPECGVGWTGSPCPQCNYEAPVPVDFQGRPFTPTPAPRDEARVREAYESLSALEAWTRPFSPDGEREKILARLAAAPRADPLPLTVPEVQDWLRELGKPLKMDLDNTLLAFEVHQFAARVGQYMAAARAPGREP